MLLTKYSFLVTYKILISCYLHNIAFYLQNQLKIVKYQDNCIFKQLVLAFLDILGNRHVHQFAIAVGTGRRCPYRCKNSCKAIFFQTTYPQIKAVTSTYELYEAQLTFPLSHGAVFTNICRTFNSRIHLVCQRVRAFVD